VTSSVPVFEAAIWILIRRSRYKSFTYLFT